MEKKINLSWRDLITHFWNVSHVKTFNGKCFTVEQTLEGRGFVFSDKQSGDIKEIPEIFYSIRFVFNHSGEIIARRSNKDANLILYLRVNDDSYSFHPCAFKRNRNSVFTMASFKKRIGNVSNTQLRKWEESGMLVPELTPKGIRLYSYQDIKKAKRLLQTN